MEFFAGVADLGRGFRYWSTSPRLMLLGVLPALIVGAIWTGAFLDLATDLDSVVAWLTPFAGGWGALQWPVRVIVGASVLVAMLLVAGLAFTAVVLTVADPFYERISHDVEARLGNPPDQRDDPWLRSVLRAARDGLMLLLASVLVGIAAFLLGLIPIAGPIIAAVFGAAVGGWFLVVELTGTPFDARGYTLRERRAVLRRSRARVLGFGAATWLLFLIPLGAVVVMPAAVSGATVLARAALARATGDPSETPPARPPG